MQHNLQYILLNNKKLSISSANLPGLENFLPMMYNIQQQSRGKGDTMITAAIFDMDGLMFDTERLVYENWQRMMDERGYDYSLDDYKQTVGRRKLETQRFYYGKYGDDFPYRELSERGRKMYVDRVRADGLPIKKGLIELLEFLRGRGVKIALATSTSRQTASFNLDVSGTTK